MNMTAYRAMNATQQKFARRLAGRAEDVEVARDKLHEMVVDADEAGLTVSQIAAATGVTRQTVYAWLGRR